MKPYAFRAQSQIAHYSRDAQIKQAVHALLSGRSILLRLPVRHEIRGPASLLAGKEAEFNQVGLFSTHKCGRPPLFNLLLVTSSPCGCLMDFMLSLQACV